MIYPVGHLILYNKLAVQRQKDKHKVTARRRKKESGAFRQGKNHMLSGRGSRGHRLGIRLQPGRTTTMCSNHCFCAESNNQSFPPVRELRNLVLAGGSIFEFCAWYMQDIRLRLPKCNVYLKVPSKHDWSVLANSRHALHEICLTTKGVLSNSRTCFVINCWELIVAP